MDSSFADSTIEKMSAPLSFFGFARFDEAHKARDAFQIFYEEGNPGSLSDARLMGKFDTLQLYDSHGVPNSKVPMEDGGTGSNPEPFTRYYPEFGEGGERQLVPKDKVTVKFDEVELIPEEKRHDWKGV